MKHIISTLLLMAVFACSGRSPGQAEASPESVKPVDSVKIEVIARKPPMVAVIEKELLYDKYTLEDNYLYGEVERSFQWDKIRPQLVYIDSIQLVHDRWGVLQNYKNRNGEAPLVGSYTRNAYKRIQDDYGVERYQSVPLYSLADTITPVRYGHDGHLVRIIADSLPGSGFATVENVDFPGRWLVPVRYLLTIEEEKPSFHHVIVADRMNQNIATLEKVGEKWLVRSMNPATTGAYNPPVQMLTPLGIYVLMEKKAKMIYLTDDGKEVGGYAPWASRFCNGGYLHGVPVNVPRTEEIEFGSTLGTIPRSHMCVRNATSHAKFIYDWAPVLRSLVVVIE